MPHLSRALAVLVGFAILSAVGLSSAHAQEVTEPPTSPSGFDDPDDITDIDQYRLPSWSFTTVVLDLSGGGRRSSSSSELDDRIGFPDSDRDNASLQLNLAPSLNTFTESEDRRFRLNVNPRLGVSGSGTTEEENGEQVFESDGRAVATSLGATVDWTEYVSGDLFLQARSANRGVYNRSSIAVTDDGTQLRDEVDVRVRYLSRTRLGIGFGRLRDVTPVIRALRVRERLKELGRGEVLTSENIQAAAQQFARRPGYAPVYDRGDKYFWNDFFSGIEDQSSELLAYESFYLAESLVEQIARRQEGYEVSAGVNLNYDNSLDKTDRESGADQRLKEISSSVGLFTQGRYATNLSLRQQITVFGGADYGVPTQEDTSVDGVLEARLGGRHLWEIADRYQLITSAATQYQRTNVEDGEARTGVNISASSDFAVFVENNVRLNAGLDYFFSTEGNNISQRTANEVRFSFGINYFLFRGLK